MRTQTIQCDCCDKVLKPGEFFEVRLDVRGHGKTGKIPDGIVFDDICRECMENTYKLVEDKGKKQ